jgi:AraC-like DNA-binding protein
VLDYASFTTEADTGDFRVKAWGDALGDLSLRLLRLDDDGGFHGRVRSLVSPQGISFIHVASGAQVFAGAAAKADDSIWLALHLGGKAQLETALGVVDLAPGDIAYGPLRATFTLRFVTDFQALFVTIPRAIFETRLMTGLVQRVGRLCGQKGIGPIFGEMLGSVAVSLDKLTADQLRPVEIALIEFLAACLTGETPQGGLRGATSTQMNILNRICQMIEAHLGEHDFSRATVAHKEGISARYVQKLFENAGETFGHYLRVRRLERSRTALADPVYAHLSITEICYRWGFNDSAHFSRAFRDQYGISPRAYRKGASATAA